MSSVTEAWKAGREGFVNKDSSRLAEFFTDDFRFVSTIRDIGKQEALDWTAGGGNQTAMDNLEVLYENDEVAVTYHSATSTLGDGVVMALYTKKDGKISQCRIVRQAI
ncbi:MAG: nuclear transport factor 2 family protein [Dehalococcoidia bacterium]|nr:nuclear transport factor 2 family protein [Dehalococcoidia bacterium]